MDKINKGIDITNIDDICLIKDLSISNNENNIKDNMLPSNINKDIDDICLIKDLSISNNENNIKDNILASNKNNIKYIDDICLIKDLSINDLSINDNKDINNINKDICLTKNLSINNNENNIKVQLFDKKKYFENLDLIIFNILTRHENNTLTYDILDTEKIINNKKILLKEKQRQMKIGEIWQEVLGNYHEYTNLKIGHTSGLDILSHTKKVAIELKNRTNTDNASSKKSNFDKLANFKKKNPEYTCIYANINDDTKEKTLKGLIKNIIHNGVEIQHQVGYIFLNFILGSDVDIVIEFVKNRINKYIS